MIRSSESHAGVPPIPENFEEEVDPQEPHVAQIANSNMIQEDDAEYDFSHPTTPPPSSQPSSGPSFSRPLASYFNFHGNVPENLDSNLEDKPAATAQPMDDFLKRFQVSSED